MSAHMSWAVEDVYPVVVELIQSEAEKLHLYQHINHCFIVDHCSG